MGLFKKSKKKVEMAAEKVIEAVEVAVEKVTDAVQEVLADKSAEEETAAVVEEAAQEVQAAEPVAESEADVEAAAAAAAAIAAADAEYAEAQAAEEAALAEATEEAPAETAEEAVEEPAEEAVVEETIEAAADEAEDESDPYNGMLHIIDHPMVQHKLTIMRDKDTGAKDFRELLDEIAMLVGYEVTRELPLCDVEVETPIQKMTGKAIAGKKLAIVPILRAGLGMVDGLQRLVPAAKVGHIGLYRHPETHMPVDYYCKLPEDIGSRLVIITDPMLATGGSAIEAIRMLKEKGCTDIRMMCLVAAPEGVSALHEAHPDVPIFTAALDECLNEKAYIVPGLGDAGDRLFGTY